MLYVGMDASIPVLQHFSDSDLLAEVSRLSGSERAAIANLVSALGELDARRLYLGQGCASMFTYCTQVLHLAEHAAFNRIEAARAARRFPTILTMLADGRVHLSAIRLLAPHLTEANHQDVLREASHKTKRQIEEIVARLQPRPDVPTAVRKLPSTHLATPAVSPLELRPTVPCDRMCFDRDRHATGDATRAHPAAEGRTTRPGAIQTAVHGGTGDLSETPSRSGSSPSLSTQRRPCGNIRPGVDAAAHRSGKNETCRYHASACIVTREQGLATRSGRGSAGGLGPRRWAMSIRRPCRPLC